jgi:hypothetical protein
MHDRRSSKAPIGFILCATLTLVGCGGSNNANNPKADAKLTQAGAILPTSPSNLPSVYGNIGSYGVNLDCQKIEAASQLVHEASLLYIDSGNSEKADKIAKLSSYLTYARSDCSTYPHQARAETTQKFNDIGTGANALVGR